MPGPEDLDDVDPLADYEPEGGESRPMADADDVDPLEGYDPISASGDLVAEAQAETGDLGDLALGGIDGLLLNYGDELGGLGQDIANSLGRRDDVTYADDGGAVVDYDAAKQTTMGKVGNAAGNVATGTAVGLATGGLGTVGAQAGIGAGMGTLAGFGQSHDPVEALLGGATGGALGAGGRLLGGALGKARPSSAMLNNADSATMVGSLPDDAIPLPQYADDLASLVPERVPGTSTRMFEATAAKPASDGWMSEAAKLLVNAKTGGMLGAGRKIASVMGQVTRPSPDAVKAMVSGAAGGLNTGLASELPENVSAQVARPDVPTLTWAMQSVNAGSTGLPQDAQARLDEALMSGDDDKVSSVYMQYSLKYPAFQKRMQAELEAVNGGN